MVAVRRDQCQRFCCPVLLDTSASHGSRPSGDTAHEPSHSNLSGSSHLRQILGKGKIVRNFQFAAFLLIPGLLLDGTPPAQLHTVRLTGDAEKGEYRFSPSRLTANRGDTLVFRVESGGPHALGIDPAGLSPVVRDAWNQALPRRRGLLRGPLIRDNQPYMVVIPRAVTPGKYTIFCLPHRAYDMRVDIEVR